jgi:hypothetical protein
MNRIISKIALLTVTMVAIIPAMVYAQGGPGFGGGVDDGGVCVPLDGGLSILAAAGVGYGIKKYTAHKKQQAEAKVK